MPTWVKVVLVVVLVGFVALTAGIILTARWLRHRGESFVKESERVIAEGKAFGQGKDAEACTTESLARLKTCNGLICEAQNNVFYTQCLQAATVAPETCAAIPKQDEFIATAHWQRDECAKRGWGNDQRCPRLMQVLQVHCHHPR